MASRQPTSTLLDLGQRDDPAVLVADRREVAHLGHGDEALVGRVRREPTQSNRYTSPARRQAGDLEVRQPPHLQPPGDHRVQPAELDVLLEAARRPDAAPRPGRHPERSLADVVEPPEREHVARRAGM